MPNPVQQDRPQAHHLPDRHADTASLQQPQRPGNDPQEASALQPPGSPQEGGRPPGLDTRARESREAIEDDITRFENMGKKATRAIDSPGDGMSRQDASELGRQARQGLEGAARQLEGTLADVEQRLEKHGFIGTLLNPIEATGDLPPALSDLSWANEQLGRVDTAMQETRIFDVDATREAIHDELDNDSIWGPQVYPSDVRDIGDTLRSLSPADRNAVIAGLPEDELHTWADAADSAGGLLGRLYDTRLDGGERRGLYDMLNEAMLDGAMAPEDLQRFYPGDENSRPVWGAREAIHEELNDDGGLSLGVTPSDLQGITDGLRSFSPAEREAVIAGLSDDDLSRWADAIGDGGFGDLSNDKRSALFDMLDKSLSPEQRQRFEHAYETRDVWAASEAIRKELNNDGVLDFDVTYRDLVGITDRLGDFSPDDRNAVIARLSDADLERWADEIDNRGILPLSDGLSDTERRELTNMLDQSPDKSQLERFHNAFDNRGEWREGEVERAVENTRAELNNGVWYDLDFMLTGGELRGITRRLQSLEPAQRNDVVGGLSDADLDRWADGIKSGGLTGLNGEERAELTDMLDKSLEPNELERFYSAYGHF